MQISIDQSFVVPDNLYHIQGLQSMTSGERMANLHGDDENEYLTILILNRLVPFRYNWDILFQQTIIFHLSECSQPVEYIVCLNKSSRVRKIFLG